ncbi:MAG: OmpA family protein [Syntrophales bacterium]|jgi:OOP family OmpA-OmpF porin
MKENRGVYHSLAVLVVMLFLFFTGSALASSQDLNAKIGSGQYIQNADNLYIIFDKSGSMLEDYAGTQKFVIEKKLVSLFNRTIPDLDIKAGLRTFGNNFINFDVTKLTYGIVKYSPDGLDKAIKDIGLPFGNSPLDIAITAAGDDLKPLPGKSALVIFSDGEDMDNAPVKAATTVKNKFGDNLCIYTVQIGNDEKGGKILKQVAQAGQCGVAVKGDKLAGDAAMTDFVEKIFLAEKPPTPPPPPPPPVKEPEIVPAPLPPPPPPPVEEIKKAPEVEQQILEKGRATLMVEFDTGKAVVKPKYYKEIENVADVMKKHPDLMIVIEGHTDNVGGEKYNLTLSKKRAEAIKRVMVTKFNVETSRIMAKGFGYSKPIVSNKTADGRQKNRRVEAAVDYTIQK